MSVFCALRFFPLFAVIAVAQIVASGPIEDSAGVLNDSAKKQVQQISSELEQKTGVQLLVATTADTGGLTPGYFAQKLARERFGDKPSRVVVIAVAPWRGNWTFGVNNSDDLDAALPHAQIDAILPGAAHTHSFNEWVVYLASHVAQIVAENKDVELTTAMRSAGPNAAADRAARAQPLREQSHDRGIRKAWFSISQDPALLALFLLFALIPILTIAWLISFLQRRRRGEIKREWLWQIGKGGIRLVPAPRPLQTDWHSPTELCINCPRPVRMKMRGFASLAPEVIVISGVSLWVTAAFGGHGVNPHQLIALLVPAAYVWILTSRLWLPVVRGRKLLERGLVAKGTIVGKRFARRGNWGGDQLWYEFQPNGGTPVRGTVQPLSNNILKLRVGESVTVLYYANDPATSTIYPLALWEVDA